MNDRTIVAWDWGWRLRLRFFWRVCNLPFAQRRPALVVGAAQNGGIANRNAIRLRFIDNAIIERHGLRLVFIDAGIMEAAFVEDGYGKDVRSNNPR